MSKTILVGDIGSTKSTWWFNSPASQEITLTGFNPMVHSGEAGSRLFETLRSKTGQTGFSEIWYYGAGIVDHQVAQKVRHQILDIFPSSQVHVSSDLAGAAAAACGNEPGTVAILGTGSHAATWDGHKILEQATSLGFILGDEGGGCDIGKVLLQAYFYKEMPQAIMHEMAKKLTSGRAGLLRDLQTSETPNQFLADFARIAVLFQEHEWIKNLVSSRFSLFIRRHLVPLNPSGTVHVVGSIGCIFASLIKHELEDSGMSAGQFIKDPAHRLFERHYEHE
jgi:N-acetylglucosamine kinase-like BadF-type ATPase